MKLRGARFWLFVVSAASVALVAHADELAIAKEALRDGLWEVARTHAGHVIATNEAKLVVLESLACEDRWKDVASTLGAWDNAKGDGFDYYRAVIGGDLDSAMKILARGGSKEGITEVRLHQAELLSKKGDRAKAKAVWREICATSNVTERALAVASANLEDAAQLRKAYGLVRVLYWRQLVGLRLGRVLLRDDKTAKEGESLIRSIVRDKPDVEGAKEAFLAVADAKLSAARWKEAVETFREVVDMWPEAVRMSSVHEGRGWALQELGQRKEALEAFRMAGTLADNDRARATALLKEGDVLAQMGLAAESMAKYREVIKKYPQTTVAEKLKAVVRLREMEEEGCRMFRNFRFGEAQKLFGQVAEADSARRQRMKYFIVLCLYGQGLEDEAVAQARALVASCPEAAVRQDAVLWLAKFFYNRREWKESCRLFVAYSDASEVKEPAAEALLWAARAALAANEFESAIQLTSRLVGRYPDSVHRAGALLVQGEALVESARYDEAVLVFERVVGTDTVSAKERMRAQLQRADALYAMGADNPARYKVALEAYQSAAFGGALTASDRLVVSFKIARTLEKLKRMEEAEDQYYTQVVLAYRTGRLRHETFGDEAKAAFSRAVFRLAEEYDVRGKDIQARSVLEILAQSDVPAAEEARKMIERISNKGRFL